MCFDFGLQKTHPSRDGMENNLESFETERELDWQLLAEVKLHTSRYLSTALRTE